MRRSFDAREVRDGPEQLERWVEVIDHLPPSSEEELPEQFLSHIVRVRFRVYIRWLMSRLGKLNAVQARQRIADA